MFYSKVQIQQQCIATLCITDNYQCKAHAFNVRAGNFRVWQPQFMPYTEPCSQLYTSLCTSLLFFIIHN